MTRPRAILLILAGGTAMSFVGLMMRLMETSGGFQILFWRSISLAAMVLLVGCLERRCRPAAFLRSLDRADLAMGAALSLAFTTYVFAMLMTSVASTLFILTATPFLTALIGWAWIGERPLPITWLAMAGAVLGVALMIGDGFALGRTVGNLSAIASAAFFAVMLVLARRSKKASVLGGTFLGGLLTIILGGGATLATGASLMIGAHDIVLSLIMGGFTIGLGIALVTAGTPHVPAAEVSLLVLIESVLGPVWVWVLLGEAMTRAEIVGGLIVLTSVVGVTLAARRRGGS
jgi:DME family drug/metabolite transporter